MTDLALIRNFSIIAHIDHGKSTLSDRLIQHCGGLADREMKEQVLDSMDIERERGITIKAQSVCLAYKARDGQVYKFNFIDTPGHVDFSYEVSRSLAACEGALLVVDAGQGVQAQTVAVCNTAFDQGLEVVPVLNKIDLPQADPDRVKKEIEDIIGISAQDALLCSAKSGLGIVDLLEAIITRIPPPKGDQQAPLQALIIDSWFDKYLGVVSLVRVMNGLLRKGEKVKVMSTGKTYTAESIGIFTPKRVETDLISTGEVGFLVANVKDIYGAPVGDTITQAVNGAEVVLPGFKVVKPQVYAGMFTVDPDDFGAFREALAKLKLNDAALFYEPEQSDALGTGFRCGFLGLLHMEVVQERLEREYDINLITTAPTVVYQIETTTGETLEIENPAKLPPVTKIAIMREPIARAHILVPKDRVGPVMTLCMERRGVQVKMAYQGNQVSLTYDIPLSEVILDFFDRLKSITQGYASLDYNLHTFQEAPLVRLDILLNGKLVEALSSIVHTAQARSRGTQIAEKLKEVIPRQMYDVAIQAALGANIIARQTVKALRKNVTAKCYGGDITRKKKLLEKQKEGKKRMKRLGDVEVPQEAFMAILKVDGGGSKG